LQADHHDDRGRGYGKFQFACLAAQHLDKGVVDDLDDLLAWRDRFKDRLTDGLRGHAVDERADNGKRNIGLQQRDPHFAQGLAHVVLVERTAATQPVKDPA
jgi:hypothetical protein